MEGNLLLPIRDENRSKTSPYITRILIIVNVVAFLPLLYYIFFPGDANITGIVEYLYENFMMIPEKVIQGKDLFTLITSMFLHADIFHIGGNMLFLFVFGDNIEDNLGHLRFLIFYIFCGLIADFIHILSLNAPLEFSIPVLGASGAISGVMGAYLVRYPKAKILTLLLIRFIYFVRIPAIGFIGFWFILQLLYSMLDMGGGVAYWAHIGGFIAGLILMFVSRKK